MGMERQPVHFARFEVPEYLEWYLGRGNHHLKWRIGDAHRAGHIQLLLKILERSPQCRPAMLSVLQFEPEAVDDAVMPLTTLRLPVPLSIERARFMLTLLKARRERLLEALMTP